MFIGSDHTSQQTPEWCFFTRRCDTLYISYKFGWSVAWPESRPRVGRPLLSSGFHLVYFVFALFLLALYPFFLIVSFLFLDCPSENSLTYHSSSRCTPFDCEEGWSIAHKEFRFLFPEVSRVEWCGTQKMWILAELIFSSATQIYFQGPVVLKIVVSWTSFYCLFIVCCLVDRKSVV